MSTPQTGKAADGRFRFALAGVRFEGKIEDSSGPAAMLRLSADLGGLPYSAEDREARRRWQNLLETADPAAPDHHVLAPDRHIHFDSATKVDGPLAGPRLIEVLTVILLTLRSRLGAPAPAPARRFRAEGRG